MVYAAPTFTKLWTILTMLTELFRIALHISSVKAFLHTIDTTDEQK